MRKLLIIEDDPVTSKFLKSVLMKDMNLDIKISSTYIEALALISNYNFDLFILDLNLEGYSGLDILKNLSLRSNISNRVILISTETTLETKILGFSLGASNFVEKPIKVDLLKSILNKNLKMIDEFESQKIKFGELTIDPSTYKIYFPCEGKITSEELTFLEFKFIWKLAKSIKAIVTKNSLSELGVDRPISNKAIEMHISNLRKKLASSSYVIQTKRGVGYILEKK